MAVRALGFFLAAAAWLAGGVPSHAALRVQARECISCHSPVEKELAKKFLHAPFKDPKNCESCHKRHGVVGTLVLKEPEPGLCFSCHKKEEPAFKLARVHAPVAQGKCSSCHSPHSSDNALQEALEAYRYWVTS